VLLLHGHGRTGMSMTVLATVFRTAGYATLAPSYGLRRTMPAILERLHPRVDAFQQAFDGPLHIVTHSLGGLVARALLHDRRPARLGRVVMLAPPNSGSELADLLFRWRLHRTILGPVGGHLRTVRAEEEERLLGRVDYPLGVIAGDRSLSPMLPERLLPRPNDGMVSVAATRIDGMADHIVLPVPHPVMVHHPRSIEQALAFIRTGAFRRG
jgi:pimeloyl-ACP methyl ester carboxylesterase